MTRDTGLQCRLPAVQADKHGLVKWNFAHTHHPVDDAKGNAEALLRMKKEMGLKIKL